MSYTLANVTALAFDLVRRPHGNSAAAIVLTALTACRCRVKADPLVLVQS